MNDLEEYEQLSEDEEKIKKKLIEGVPSDESVKLFLELNTIKRRKIKIRNRMLFLQKGLK